MSVTMDVNMNVSTSSLREPVTAEVDIVWNLTRRNAQVCYDEERW